MPDNPSDRPHAGAADLRFGPSGRFELQPGERRLLVDGRPAPLGARAFDLLAVLAARPDRLVSKNELLDRVWPGLVVEESNLHVQISHLRKLLGGDVIATVPGRGYRFVAATSAPGSDASAASRPAPVAATETLPPAAPRLVGRSRDLARLESSLRQPGCVTLVGTSGVGKTSLARAIAARRAGASVWVDLAPLVQSSQVAGALARALGVQLEAGDALPALRQALQGTPTLIVLDNAEHLVEACAALATQLCSVPTATLLVTSQVPLSVAVERVQRLEPLAVDGDDGDGDGDHGDGGALTLLAERIAAADPRFALDDTTRPVLAEICVQLDGLPLALEMAAARVRTLGLSGVRDALAHRFSLLTRGHRDAAARHRTLHHAVDWSYRLLGADEQRLFRALGVFAGGFTLELAIALAVGEHGDDDARWAVIDTLSALVDRSLVTVSDADPPRYRLLETLRAFALEQLALAVAPDGEDAAVRRRHAEALTALFGRRTFGDPAAQRRCEVEMENAREAIAWARVNDLGLAALLTAGAAQPATYSAWRHEATQWLQALEPAMRGPEGLALPTALQADWWLEMARGAVMRRDPRGGPFGRAAFELWLPLHQPGRALLAAATWVRGTTEPGPELDAACDALRSLIAAMPSPTAAQRLQAQSALVVADQRRGDLVATLAGRLQEMALASEAGSRAWAEAAESNVLGALNALGRYADAAERGRVMLARIEARAESPSNANLPWVFCNLIESLAEIDAFDEAQAMLPKAFAACGAMELPVILPALALLAARQGRADLAAMLVGHAQQDAATRQQPIESSDEVVLARARALAESVLGAERIAALVDEGRRLDAASLPGLLGTAHCP